MRRSLVRKGVLLSAAALVATTLLAAAPASAGGGDDGSGFGSPPPTTSSSEGTSQQGGTYVPQVIVTVTSAGTRTSTVTSAPSVAYIHPPCWQQPSWTGPERADYYDSGDAAADARHHDDPGISDEPPGYGDHKADGPDKGMWYSSMCSSEFWTDGDIHAFVEFADQWITSHPTIWVAVGDPDPNRNIVIPPEALMHIARSALKPGAPTLEVNPQTHSVVNLATWVWATDATFVQMRARAEFNGNYAEVIADPTGLVLHTTGPADVKSGCADGGKVWHRGIAGDTTCSVTFSRSTANRGSYSISATIDWQVHWVGSGGQNAGLPAPPNPPIGQRNVLVDEVQTVVNGQPTP